MYFGVNHVLIGFEAGSGREMRVHNVNHDLFECWNNNPRVLLFLGIVTRKCIFVKICVWLSNSNRIACVGTLAQVS